MMNEHMALWPPVHSGSRSLGTRGMPLLLATRTDKPNQKAQIFETWPEGSLEKGDAFLKTTTGSTSPPECFFNILSAALRLSKALFCSLQEVSS